MKNFFKVALLLLAFPPVVGAYDFARHLLISADVNQGVITSSAVVSSIIGADTFYGYGIYGGSTSVAVMETGRIFTDHAIFDNSNLGGEFFPDGLSTDYISAHKTACAGIISGIGPEAPGGGYYTMCLGIAPLAQLSSGLTGDDSMISFNWYYQAYKHFFADSPADVISTSETPVLTVDPSTPVYYALVDALASRNTLTTFVCAAGNEGPNPDTVCHLGYNYNGITVGALGNHFAFDTVADFSSRGASAFFNPSTGEITAAARATIDITAPGENIVVAAYDAQSPSTEMMAVGSGTSYAAPITAGVVSLMDAASKILEADANAVANGWSSRARDSRVIKAVMLNSADKPADWDNGQAVNASGIVETVQSLDFAYGAGVLNADAALSQYINFTDKSAWVLDSLYKNSSMTYSLGELSTGDLLTATLVWLVQGGVEEVDAGGGETDISLDFTAFADLNLELLCEDGTGLNTIALSDSPYNTVEHLYLRLAQTGNYYLRVIFNEVVYGETGAETYALAWNIVPEPCAAAALLGLAALAAALLSNRQRRQRRFYRR